MAIASRAARAQWELPEAPEPGDDLDAAAFAVLVRDASDEALEELMTTEDRETVLDAVFSRLPKRLRSHVPRDLDAVIHWRIGAPPAGAEDLYELRIRDGACTARKSASRQPDATIRIVSTAFLRLATGAGEAQSMVGTDQLKLEGDAGLALRVEALFDRA